MCCSSVFILTFLYTNSQITFGVFRVKHLLLFRGFPLNFIDFPHSDPSLVFRPLQRTIVSECPPGARNSVVHLPLITLRDLSNLYKYLTDISTYIFTRNTETSPNKIITGVPGDPEDNFAANLCGGRERIDLVL